MAKTPAQRKYLLQRRKITITPSPMYLELLEMLECGEVPSAALVDQFLTHDRVMSFIKARVVDWVLWRFKEGRPLQRGADTDAFSVALQATHDTAVAEMDARWAKQDRLHGRHDATAEDGQRLAHDGTWSRRR